MRNLTVSDYPKKILIVGTSGCGKTTLANCIAKRTGRECVDLDDLYWLPNWTPRPEPEFQSLLQQTLAKEEWIIGGNYSRACSVLREQADMVIWLDLPRYICLWHAAKRSVRRIFSREPCCNGNYETLQRQLGKDSIFRWIWTTYTRRKKTYNEYFAANKYQQRLVRISSRREVLNSNSFK